MAESGIIHLDELNNSKDYEISEGQPDITRWNIMDDTGKKIGTVKDLLFDKDNEKVRYIITNLKDGVLEEDRRVLIPIGKARLDRDENKVVIPQVTRGNLSELPHYRSTKDMTTEDEHAIRKIFTSKGTAEETGTYNKNKFYEHEDFDEDLFYEGGEAGRKGPTDKFPGKGVKPGKGAESKPMSRIKKREVGRPVEERVEENFEEKRTTSQKAEGRNTESEDKYILKKGEKPEGGGAQKEVRVVEKVSGENKGTNAETTPRNSEENRRGSLDKGKNPGVDVENAKNDPKGGGKI